MPPLIATVSAQGADKGVAPEFPRSDVADWGTDIGRRSISSTAGDELSRRRLGSCMKGQARADEFEPQIEEALAKRERHHDH
jgi:hypothetical protein